MQTYLSQGIVLNALDFRDFDQIVTVFTENEGVIKFIAKKGNLIKRGLKNAPLTKAEFSYTIGKSDLYFLQEISPKDHYLTLRQDYHRLICASECMRCIIETQMLHKPAPMLYKLLIAYLDKLALFTNYEAFELSFRLKTLSHEGILDLNPNLNFSIEDVAFMKEVVNIGSFSSLNAMVVPKNLSLKVKALFKEYYSSNSAACRL